MREGAVDSERMSREHRSLEIRDRTYDIARGELIALTSAGTILGVSLDGRACEASNRACRSEAPRLNVNIGLGAPFRCGVTRSAGARGRNRRPSYRSGTPVQAQLVPDSVHGPLEQPKPVGHGGAYQT